MHHQPHNSALAQINRVAPVSLLFWVIKIMATTVGETGADYLIFHWKMGLANVSWLMSAVLVATMALQLATKRYVPWIYWLNVVLISIVGTLITDSLVDLYHVPLEVTTLLFSALLAAVFLAWFGSEQTLSIRTIHSRKRELFYWAAILATFALGTSAGDLLSEQWALGYAKSGYIFAGLIAAVAAGHYLLKMNVILTFWLAYILTRPLGASLGDFLTHSQAKGGLGFGTVNTSLAFLVVIVAAVGYLTVADRRSLPSDA